MLVGFYKVGSGKPSITWTQSVDEALCFGWIDGIRKSIDHESYCIRFTPRKPKGNWSAINIAKIEQLKKQGKMYPAGLASFQKREETKSRIYSYETDHLKLTKPFEKKLKANQKAWRFFQSQAPYYQRTAVNWVLTAKQEKTQNSRIETLINDSEAGLKIKPLRYGTKTS